MSSRRDFVRHLGGAALAAAIPARVAAAMESGSGGVEAPAARIRIGCAAITWGDEIEPAVDDIGALGYRGVQLRANAVERYRGRTAALRALLKRHRLTFVALSSGNVSADPAARQRMIDLHVDHARFLRDAGGLYLQLIDERPAGRAPDQSDYERLGALMTEIGHRAAAPGVTVGYHPHMGSMGEKPEDAERVLAASDPRYVKLLLDVAHWQAGGGDPVAAIRRHADRLLFLHIKDVRRTTEGAGYGFVELGRGAVDLAGVFAALRAVRFRGWGIVELDSVPAGDGTPKEANAASKRYLEQTLHVGV